MVLKLLKLTAGLVLPLLLVYFLQTRVLFSIDGKNLNLVNFCYLFNFGFSYIFLFNFFLFKTQLISYIGYLFLAFSSLKLILFAYLVKSSNYELDKSVFFYFFIPFVVCIGLEIFYLSQELNRANFNNNN